MKLLENPKLEALRVMTLSMVRNRGNVSQEELEAFYGGLWGATSTRDYPVVLKTISNYANHIANTPVDAGFQKICLVKK
jgi:hypothetical protein